MPYSTDLAYTEFTKPAIKLRQLATLARDLVTWRSAGNVALATLVNQVKLPHFMGQRLICASLHCLQQCSSAGGRIIWERESLEASPNPFF
ncbi:unnamed protein product [Protopolystoma xenopodis]|uniref:Uncharacterized protein n=1 Tax=Protopolystoma xenopodis TaxID=117903 RepID=A0A3S5AQP7_9PLAT|nr:unnamed protein product [Protopolystoma xenopodis]